LAPHALLSFAGRAKFAVRSGFSGLSEGAVYTEKEQSTDSAATDVEKDFNVGWGSNADCDRDRDRSWSIAPMMLS
jgi:hypothetical protein